jgi:hypothetical protein
MNLNDFEAGQTFNFPGPWVVSIDDPDRGGYLKSISDCGDCIYVLFMGKVSGNCGVRKDLYRLA